MTHPTALVVAAALCVAGSSPLRAQEDVLRPTIPSPITYLAETGINYNAFSQTITRAIDAHTPFDAVAAGNGVSPYVSIGADYAISKRAGIQLKLAYDQKRFSGNAEGLADIIIVHGPEAIEYDTVMSYLDYEVTVNYLDIAALVRLDVVDDLFVTAGPIFQMRLDSTRQRNTNEIRGASDGEYFDAAGNPAGKSVTTEFGIQSKPSTRFGLAASAGYRIAVSKSVAVVPQIRFQYMLTELIEDRSTVDDYRPYSVGPIDLTLTETMLHSVQLGVGIHFGL